MLEGQCHCGAVSWQFDAVPESATICNCSVCRRYAALWIYDYENEAIRITGQTSYYKRGKALEFHFCSVCSCVTHWRALKPEDDARRRMAVNIRLASPELVSAISIDHFDGLSSFQDFPKSGKCVADYLF